jgi:hypothetical protein
MLRINRLAGAGAVAAAVALSIAVTAAALPDAAVPEVLFSRQLMEQEGIRVGDIVTLAADSAGARSRAFRVAAEYEPTPDPMKFAATRLEARLHLPDLLAIAADPADPQARDAVDTLNVRLADPGEANEVSRLLATRTAGLVVRPTARATDGTDTFAVLDRFHLAMRS